MLSVKRNQVIVTMLVVMIAVAGYLNIADANKAAETLSQGDEVVYRELQDGTLVPDTELMEVISANTLGEIEGEIGIAVSTEEDLSIYTDYGDEYANYEGVAENVGTVRRIESEPGQAIFVNSTSQNNYAGDYFVSAKLDREQTRAKEKDILTEMLDNQNLAKEDVSMFASALLDIQKRIEKETAAEAMIEAKGFKEAYVRIDDETVDVVVSKSALTEAEIAQIEDIVTRKTGFASEKIKISTLKAAS